MLKASTTGLLFRSRIVLQVIRRRRTVREFQAVPIPSSHITKILEAACQAPTAGNQQPWRFLIVQSKRRLFQLRKLAGDWYIRRYAEAHRPGLEELHKIRRSVDDMLKRAFSAPLFIAILADTKAKYKDYVMQDACLAAANLMIAACALGYGTAFYTTLFPDLEMRRLFNIPDRYRLVCFTPVGVPKRWPKQPPKKKLNELILHKLSSGAEQGHE